jgi:hypothetical protein
MDIPQKRIEKILILHLWRMRLRFDHLPKSLDSKANAAYFQQGCTV